jgi:hypothetical protein
MAWMKLIRKIVMTNGNYQIHTIFMSKLMHEKGVKGEIPKKKIYNVKG